MFEKPRRGRQARNFTTNVPKILILKSSSEQIFSENCRWVPLTFGVDGWLIGMQLVVEFIVSSQRRLVRKDGKHESCKQRCCSLCWKLPDRAQSFGFCLQFGQQVQTDRSAIEREKEKVGGRPAKLNEKKGDEDLK